MRMAVRLLACGLVVAGVVVPALATALPLTVVFLNGQRAEVFFNDGDSFRVVNGPAKFKGTKARLAGFNTLESYGNVHKWGAKTYWEQYANAKQGTLNGRKGVWKCWTGKIGDKNAPISKDGYGRILWWCPDLAYSQIVKGLAHTMSMTKGGNPTLNEAQRIAIKNRVGMWSRGVPEYILTSTHSWDEAYAKERGMAYNRLVSIKDGYSQKWLHRNPYKECHEVCRWRVVDMAPIERMAAQLPTAVTSVFIKDGKVDSERLERFRNKYDVSTRKIVVKRFAEIGEVHWDYVKDADDKAAIKKLLTPWREAGKNRFIRIDSCMIYAPFTRRYGKNSATCLH